MKHLPKPTFPKTRLMMSTEFGMDVRTFKRKLAQNGIALPHGLILPKDQMRIYKALGPPSKVWTDDGLVPFLK